MKKSPHMTDRQLIIETSRSMAKMYLPGTFYRRGRIIGGKVPTGWAKGEAERRAKQRGKKAA